MDSINTGAAFISCGSTERFYFDSSNPCYNPKLIIGSSNEPAIFSKRERSRGQNLKVGLQ